MRERSSEMAQIIELVKAQPDKPVEQIVLKYMAGITWSIAKDEFSQLSQRDRKKLYHKLQVIRNIHQTQKALKKLTEKKDGTDK